MKYESALLTIAIPTFNRGAILRRALQHLGPQLEEFSAVIDLVVSDNGSIDDTPEVIENFRSHFPTIRFTSNRNSENIGFYGNAKICRELAHGKYLWLLSDDDLVENSIIGKVLNCLQEQEIAFVYLENQPSALCIQQRTTTVGECIREKTYQLGLISSVIFINDKLNDDLLFDKYNESPFIGFIMLLNACKQFERVLVLKGKCLVGAIVSREYNLQFFEIWAGGMNDVVNYMPDIGLSRADICHFRRSYLVNFVLVYYLRRKNAPDKMSFRDRTSEFLKINLIVRRSFSDLWSYWLLFYPATLIPARSVKWSVSAYKLIKGYQKNL